MNKIFWAFFYAVFKKADSQKPLDEVRAEAEKTSQAELENTAKAYAQEIMNKLS